jgi:hypothetical protein
VAETVPDGMSALVVAASVPVVIAVLVAVAVIDVSCGRAEAENTKKSRITKTVKMVDFMVQPIRKRGWLKEYVCLLINHAHAARSASMMAIMA